MAEAKTISHKKSSIITSPNTPNIPVTTENISLDFYHTVENFIVIWLDGSIDIFTEECHSTVTLLQHLVHLVLIFNDSNDCVDFISNIKNEKIFLIISGSLAEIITPLLQNLDLIDSIYVYCSSKSKHEKWAKKEKNVKGIFTNIEPIYDALRRDIRQCEDDLLSFSILSPTYNQKENLNESDQLFIYTHLLKDILIEMDYKTNEQRDFADFCRLQYEQNNYQLNIIQEFRNEYKQSSSIWWSTRECFIYSMLNKAFRIRDMEMISKMGFFIRDIHREIQQLHSKLTKKDRLTVYRGQGILEEDFRKILDNPNGFLSFNNFLITTIDKQVSSTYALSARDNHGLIGVLFQMEIDPSKSSFIPLDKISYYSESEKEILFSIDTIFRITGIQSTDNGLWEIKLVSINNKNELREQFKELMREEIGFGNGSEQLEKLVNKFKIFDKFKTFNEIQDSEISSEEPNDAVACCEQPEMANDPTATDNITPVHDSPMAIDSPHEEQSNSITNDPILPS
jgi:hypothetical protein